MKVLFLDVDSIILKDKFVNKKLCKFDEKQVSQIQKIVEQTDCGIIITSSWVYETKALMKEFVRNNIEILDFVREHPTTIKKMTRGERVMKYVREHGIESFLIIDDRPRDISCIPRDHLIVPNREIGITNFEVKEAVAVLGEKV
jgi:5,10-methenyltetrahydromethanopterin hydrogenase